MAKLQNEIADSFLAKLEESPDVTREMVAALRELLSAGKKPKADDLVNVFSKSPGGNVK